jgi:glycosyltransferase involved in cell wall biosynthesis
LIIDDHSEDKTPQVLKLYEEDYDEITVIRHEENKGPGASFNTGKREAKGRYVAYLDDDDEWTSTRLETQVEKMEQLGDEYGMITGGVKRIDMDTGEVVKTNIPTYEGDIYWDLLREGSGSVLGPPSAIMLRQSAMDEVGMFREDMPRGCGQEYYRRLARNFKISFVEDIVLNYYTHSDRITPHSSIADIQNEVTARKMKLEDIEDDLKKFPDSYTAEYCNLGKYAMIVGDTDYGKKCFNKAYLVGGVKSQSIFHLLLSNFGSWIYRLLYLKVDE